MRGVNVLSLFDGMSCGQLALHRAGIKVESYYASEIDKFAIKVAQSNFPNTIQLGSVLQVDDFIIESVLPQIDILIGGSPCQGFSFAGKQLNFNDPRSALFFEYVRILNKIREKNPNVKFLLENVVMKKEYQDIITSYLGVEPILINSALVSGQNRKRLYWTNIEGVEQPEDRGIILRDILETQGVGIIKNLGQLYVRNEKSMCLDANYFKGADNHGQRTQIVVGARVVGRRKNAEGVRCDSDKNFPVKQYFEINGDPDKSNCLTTVEKDNYVAYIQSSGLICVGMVERSGYDRDNRGYSVEGKSPTILANSGGNKEVKIALSDITYRKLTPIECERLQTVPDNYTAAASNSQRYRMLGNGWTIDVVSWIFSFLKR